MSQLYGMYPEVKQTKQLVKKIKLLSPYREIRDRASELTDDFPKKKNNKKKRERAKKKDRQWDRLKLISTEKCPTATSGTESYNTVSNQLGLSSQTRRQNTNQACEFEVSTRTEVTPHLPKSERRRTTKIKWAHSRPHKKISRRRKKGSNPPCQSDHYSQFPGNDKLVTTDRFAVKFVGSDPISRHYPSNRHGEKKYMLQYMNKLLDLRRSNHRAEKQECAIRIQNMFRCFKARQFIRNLSFNLKIIKIQCFVRTRFSVRRFVALQAIRRRKRILTLQSTLRRRKAIMLANERRRLRSIIRIQNKYRQFCAKREVQILREKRSALTIQCAQRMHVSKKKLLLLQYSKASVFVQKLVRGYQLRQKLKRMISSAFNIQRVFHGARARQKARLLRAIRYDAATTIQSLVRRIQAKSTINRRRQELHDVLQRLSQLCLILSGSMWNTSNIGSVEQDVKDIINGVGLTFSNLVVHRRIRDGVHQVNSLLLQNRSRVTEVLQQLHQLISKIPNTHLIIQSPVFRQDCISPASSQQAHGTLRQHSNSNETGKTLQPCQDDKEGSLHGFDPQKQRPLNEIFGVDTVAQLRNVLEKVYISGLHQEHIKVKQAQYILWHWFFTQFELRVIEDTQSNKFVHICRKQRKEQDTHFAKLRSDDSSHLRFHNFYEKKKGDISYLGSWKNSNRREYTALRLYLQTLENVASKTSIGMAKLSKLQQAIDICSAYQQGAIDRQLIRLSSFSQLLQKGLTQWDKLCERADVLDWTTSSTSLLVSIIKLEVECLLDGHTKLGIRANSLRRNVMQVLVRTQSRIHMNQILDAIFASIGFLVMDLDRDFQQTLDFARLQLYTDSVMSKIDGVDVPMDFMMIDKFTELWVRRHRAKLTSTRDLLLSLSAKSFIAHGNREPDPDTDYFLAAVQAVDTYRFVNGLQMLSTLDLQLQTFLSGRRANKILATELQNFEREFGVAATGMCSRKALHVDRLRWASQNAFLHFCRSDDTVVHSVMNRIHLETIEVAKFRAKKGFSPLLSFRYASKGDDGEWVHSLQKLYALLQKQDSDADDSNKNNYVDAPEWTRFMFEALPKITKCFQSQAKANTRVAEPIAPPLNLDNKTMNRFSNEVQQHERCVHIAVAMLRVFNTQRIYATIEKSGDYSDHSKLTKLRKNTPLSYFDGVSVAADNTSPPMNHHHRSFSSKYALSAIDLEALTFTESIIMRGLEKQSEFINQTDKAYVVTGKRCVEAGIISRSRAPFGYDVCLTSSGRVLNMLPTILVHADSSKAQQVADNPAIEAVFPKNFCKGDNVELLVDGGTWLGCKISSVRPWNMYEVESHHGSLLGVTCGRYLRSQQGLLPHTLKVGMDVQFPEKEGIWKIGRIITIDKSAHTCVIEYAPNPRAVLTQASIHTSVLRSVSTEGFFSQGDSVEIAARCVRLSSPLPNSIQWIAAIIIAQHDADNFLVRPMDSRVESVNQKLPGLLIRRAGPLCSRALTGLVPGMLIDVDLNQSDNWQPARLLAVNKSAHSYSCLVQLSHTKLENPEVRVVELMQPTLQVRWSQKTYEDSTVVQIITETSQSWLRGIVKSHDKNNTLKIKLRNVTSNFSKEAESKIHNTPSTTIKVGPFQVRPLCDGRFLLNAFNLAAGMIVQVQCSCTNTWETVRVLEVNNNDDNGEKENTAECQCIIEYLENKTGEQTTISSSELRPLPYLYAAGDTVEVYSDSQGWTLGEIQSCNSEGYYRMGSNVNLQCSDPIGSLRLRPVNIEAIVENINLGRESVLFPLSDLRHGMPIIFRRTPINEWEKGSVDSVDLSINMCFVKPSDPLQTSSDQNIERTTLESRALQCIKVLKQDLRLPNNFFNRGEMVEALMGTDTSGAWHPAVVVSFNEDGTFGLRYTQWGCTDNAVLPLYIRHTNFALDASEEANTVNLKNELHEAGARSISNSSATFPLDTNMLFPGIFASFQSPETELFLNGEIQSVDHVKGTCSIASIAGISADDEEAAYTVGNIFDVNTSDLRQPNFTFHEGMVIENIRKGSWSKALVMNENDDGSFVVMEIESGAVRDNELPQYLRPVKSMASNDKVEVCNDSTWKPAVVNQVHENGTFDVLFDDGYIESGVEAVMLRWPRIKDWPLDDSSGDGISIGSSNMDDFIIHGMDLEPGMHVEASIDSQGNDWKLCEILEVNLSSETCSVCVLRNDETDDMDVEVVEVSIGQLRPFFQDFDAGETVESFSFSAQSHADVCSSNDSVDVGNEQLNQSWWGLAIVEECNADGSCNIVFLATQLREQFVPPLFLRKAMPVTNGTAVRTRINSDDEKWVSGVVVGILDNDSNYRIQLKDGTLIVKAAMDMLWQRGNIRKAAQTAVEGMKEIGNLVHTSKNEIIQQEGRDLETCVPSSTPTLKESGTERFHQSNKSQQKISSIIITPTDIAWRFIISFDICQVLKLSILSCISVSTKSGMIDRIRDFFVFTFQC